VASLGEALSIILPCLYVGGPSNVTLEATSPQGAPMPAIMASNYCGGQFTLHCTPPVGSMLPLGTTVVSCEASNGQGPSSFYAFMANVVDTTAPAIQVPPGLMAECTQPGGTPVFFNVL